MCLSLACYRSNVMLQWEHKHEESDQDLVAGLLCHKSEWPENNMLYMVAGDEQMSLSPPLIMVCLSIDI